MADAGTDGQGGRPDRRVAITGARGFLGSALARELTARGWGIVPIVRSPSTPGDVGWDPDAGMLDARRLEGIDAVVHLAGENIAGVWTEAKKRRIMDSRVRGTRLLARTIASLERPPAVLVSASGVGYYGDGGDTPLTEASPAGIDFLANVCKAWEGETAPAESAGIRVVRTRFGVVLHPEGGVLRLTLPIFRAGLGGRLGDGRQWLSWVWRSDAVRAIVEALTNEQFSGPVNVTAPEPVRNEEYTRELARALHRPAVFAVPAIALRAFSGGMADALLLANQRAIPAALAATGFVFEHPRLGEALSAGLN